MAKYQGPVFHRQLQEERKNQTVSPHEARKQSKQQQTNKNDVPFYRQHETKPKDDPTLSSKGLKHKVTSYQEDRSSTPFKVKQVPSPFYGYKQRKEEKKDTINYAFIYENLSKQNDEFLLFDEYLSELGEEQIVKLDEAAEEDLGQMVSEIRSIPDEPTEKLIPESQETIMVPEENTLATQEPLQEEAADVVAKETKKRGLSRSLSGMIRDEQDERLNKGRNIARYFGEAEIESQSQPATISELLAKAREGEQLVELETLLEDGPSILDATPFEEDTISTEPIVVEADYTEIEEEPQAEEVSAQPATLTELLAQAQEGESLDELEALLEKSPPKLEASSFEEEDFSKETSLLEEPPQEIVEPKIEEVATQPATITELLARAQEGEGQSDELEALLEDNASSSESSAILEETTVSEEVLVDEAGDLETIVAEVEEPEAASETITVLPTEASTEAQSNEVESFIEGEEPTVADYQSEEVIALEEQIEPETTDFEEFTEDPIEPAVESVAIVTRAEEAVEAVNEIENSPEVEEWKPDESYIVEKQLLHYQYPSLDLLQEPVTFEPNAIDDWVLEQAEILNETLEAFNVEAQVVGWTIGPAITQFELQLGRGVKVNKITNLSDDLKLSLAAKDIRIEAPIPGKSTVGVEIPNLKSRPVMISEVIDSENFRNSDSPLTIAMGVNLAGEAVVSTIDKMPHGLIAGATGSGKSVFINSLLVSLLYKATPNEVKLILIDPKAVELAPYNDLPHLLSPVISEPKAANEALKWAVNEMEERYQKLAAGGVRNIDHFNKKVEANGDFALKMPYIVIIIDELADLMMVASNEVQDSIARITQKARAAGIHLIVATQRPSVDVVTGTIKNNIPTRVAFMVSSQVDSRTILDTGGAEKLLGRGDMLFQGGGMSQPTRIQGTFVEDEIDDIVDFVKEQQEPNYLFQSESLLAKAEALEGKDDLFDEVLPFILNEGTVSASSLQRKFRIGFNRASNLIDTLESENLISENKGSKPRDVFLTRNDYEEKFL